MLTDDQIDRLWRELSHPYRITYKNPKSDRLAFATFKSGCKLTDIVVENAPAGDELQNDVFRSFLNAVAKDPVDGHLVRNSAALAPAASAGLTDEELDFAAGVEYTPSTASRIADIDERWGEWVQEDAAEEAREANNEEQREMLRQLQSQERHVPAMLRTGNASVVQRLRRVLATAWGPDGTLCVDMQAAQQVLGAFVALKMEQQFAM